jgi:hypothetical protein
MEKQLRTVSLLLVVSLLIGGYNGIQVRNLRSAMRDSADRTTQQISSAQSSIQSAVWSINNTIAQMREEERWAYPASYAANQTESTAEGVVLDISWSFREVQRGADVYLLYRPDTRSVPVEWTRVEARQLEGAAYSAPVTLSPLLNYEYQIVVEGENLRSTRPVSIPGSLYQAQPLRISSWGGNVNREGKWVGDFQFEVEQHYLSLFDFLNAGDIYLIVGREDGTSRRVEPAHVARDGYKSWFFNVAAEGLASLRVVVTYGDGAVYYKDMPLEDNWWRYHNELEIRRGDSPLTIIQP